MNKAMQICSAEHHLQQIEGHVTSKKALHKCSNEEAYSSKPNSFEQFLHELNEACSLGDQDAKLLIEKIWLTH